MGIVCTTCMVCTLRTVCVTCVVRAPWYVQCVLHVLYVRYQHPHPSPELSTVGHTTENLNPPYTLEPETVDGRRSTVYPSKTKKLVLCTVYCTWYWYPHSPGPNKLKISGKLFTNI